MAAVIGVPLQSLRTLQYFSYIAVIQYAVRRHTKMHRRFDQLNPYQSPSLGHSRRSDATGSASALAGSRRSAPVRVAWRYDLKWVGSSLAESTPSKLWTVLRMANPGIGE